MESPAMHFRAYNIFDAFTVGIRSNALRGSNQLTAIHADQIRFSDRADDHHRYFKMTLSGFACENTLGRMLGLGLQQCISGLQYFLRCFTVGIRSNACRGSTKKYGDPRH
jgi:hypothetical protein